MSRKDYRVIANTLNNEYNRSNDATQRATIFAIAVTLSDVFAINNERFNKAMFMAAVTKKDA